MIYLMRLGTYDKTGGMAYKIGKSYDPDTRVKEFEVANPNVEVSGQWNAPDEYENVLHRKLSPFRIRNEIFELTDAWVAYVAGFLDSIAPSGWGQTTAQIHECPDCGTWHI